MFISSASWATGHVDAATRRLMAWRSQYSGVPAAGRPSIPKIPDMITSSVIACIRGASENGLADRPALDLALGDRRLIMRAYCSIASP